MSAPEWVLEIARRPNSGKEFARLVRDLAAAKHQLTALSYDHRDGGIDVHIPELGFAWQCKFVNPDTVIADAVRHIKNEITSEFNKLCEQLNGADGPVRKQSQFEAWIDPSIVKKYTYATSINLSNVKKKAELETHLRRQMKNLAKVTRLKHLATVKVDVWGQQTISVKLDEFHHVRLRWFKPDLPPGVERFSDWRRRRRGSENDPQTRNFHAYLFGDVLPYQPHSDSAKRPEVILNALRGSSSVGVALIHGPGGCGKSRLMAEVARCAEDSECNVFVLSPEVRSDVVDSIVRLVTTSPALLLMDYGEYCGSIVPIYERLRTLNESANCQLALLIVSRTTTCVDGTSMDDNSVVKVHIDSADQDHIVKKILGAELEELAIRCMYIPVFAAFIRLLHDRRQHKSLDDLRREDDFHAWIRRHVAGPAANKLALGRLCSLLPCSDETMAQACGRDENVAGYRNTLVADGWLINEFGGDGVDWQIAHDLIADGAIIDLLASERTAAHVANEVLKFSAMSNTQWQCIRALNRCAEDPRVASVDWHRLFSSQTTEWAPFLHDIARGSLVSKERMLSLMTAMGITIDQLDDNVEIPRVIGLIVKDAAFKRRPITVSETQWVERVIEQSQPADIAPILSNWLRSDGDSIRASEATITWLRSQPTHTQAGQVYAGWLRSGRPWNAIAPDFNKWLALHNSAGYAVFPIAAWLETLQGQTTADDGEDWYAEDRSIGNVVHRWLVAYAHYTSWSAGLLYKAWINTTKNVSAYERKIINWLKVHRCEYSSQFLLGALFQHGYPPQELSWAMEAWLSRPSNVTHWDASYLYFNWLKSGGSPSLVRDPIMAWLATKVPGKQVCFGSTLDGGRRVLTSWLEKSSEVAAVEAYVVQWLGHEDQHLEDVAQYIFVSWLIAKGDQKVIKAKLIDWLRRPPIGNFENQEQVLSCWLKSQCTNLEDAEPFVRRWCNDPTNAVSERADFLVANWRRAGGASEVVRTAIEHRCKAYKVTADTYFAKAPLIRVPSRGPQYMVSLIQSIQSADLPIQYADQVRRAIILFGNESDKLVKIELDHLLRYWVTKMSREGVILMHLELLQWIEGLQSFRDAPYSLPELLGVRDVAELGRKVEALALAELESKTRVLSHLYIFRGWVRSGRALADVQDYLNWWFTASNGLDNPKCGEIVRALRASELGQEDWVAQVIKRFAEKYGSAAIST